MLLKSNATRALWWIRGEFWGVYFRASGTSGDHLNWPDFIVRLLDNNGSLKCLFRVFQTVKKKSFVALNAGVGLLVKLMRETRQSKKALQGLKPSRARNHHQRSRSIRVGHLVKRIMWQSFLCRNTMYDLNHLHSYPSQTLFLKSWPFDPQASRAQLLLSV